MQLISIIIFLHLGTLSKIIHGMRLRISPKDPLNICTNDCVQLTLYESDNTYIDTISLRSSYPDVARVTPSTIPVSPNVTLSLPVEICGMNGGYTTIKIKGTNDKTLPVYIPVVVSRLRVLKLISEVTGWIYFISWSISYYPQMYTNYARKSVVGLNFDYASLNIIGFILYSTYNCGMYFSDTIKREYFHFHPKGMNPVMLNDVIFSLHAFVATCVIIYQCFVYERGTQKVSCVAKIIMALYAIIVITSIILASRNVLSWLEFILYCSYIKLSVTIIKYIPQAIMNYSRKSTVGWSIENVLLDFIGGLFSMTQMAINSYNYNDWDSIFGDPTKFGLGLFSVMFDVFFMYQHYVLYRIPYEEQIDEIPPQIVASSVTNANNAPDVGSSTNTQK